ncbi:MAG: DUF3426 domain-containing protein [Gallionella sp.]|nr:DUF3426 domain-containing protein [Gallionella sp.]MDD4947320.1 DUF3426 domain-containing protein [Gallionella sp.]
MTDGTTLCPHCATRFRIAEAQLNAHGGMVRCGHCRQAFDAKANYQPDQPSPQLDLPIEPVSVVEAVNDRQIAMETDTPKSCDPVNLEVHLPEAPQASESESPAQEAEGAASAIDQSGETDAVVTAAHSENDAPSIDDGGAPVFASDTTSDDIEMSAPSDTSVAGDSLDFSLHTTATETPIAPQEIPAPIATPSAPLFATSPITPGSEGDILLTGYQPDAEQYAETTPPLKKHRVWPWMTGIFIMLLVLTAQSAYFFRTGLASRAPGLQPVLLAYCDMLGCNIPLPRDAELISIESSSLNADANHANQVNLEALLRNRAGYTLAFPALSLTLNDMQDKPLANRIFLPADYLPATEKVASGMATNRELSIQLHMDTGDLRPIGYRLELFYPQ